VKCGRHKQQFRVKPQIPLEALLSAEQVDAGGSGTDDEDLRKAIGAGINIVHINTELRVAWRRGLEEGLSKEPDEVVPYKILPFAAESVERVVRSRLALFNTAG
jgi:fructose/tagatose bisphosphate aldolase